MEHVPTVRNWADSTAGANACARSGAAGRGVYPVCMPEVSSVPAQWPVSGDQIDSGVASRRPISAGRHHRL